MYQLIETKTLASPAANISFTNIPQDGTDLLVVASLRADTVGGGSQVRLSFNGSTANFSQRFLYGTGASALSGTGSEIGFYNGSSEGANIFSSSQYYIANYTGNSNKSFSAESAYENNSATAYMAIHAGLWSNTSAITSINLAPMSGNWVAGTTISLYKITRGTGGATVS